MVSMLFLRILAEERLLSGSPEYQAYQKQVRYRLNSGCFKPLNSSPFPQSNRASSQPNRLPCTFDGISLLPLRLHLYFHRNPTRRRCCSAANRPTASQKYEEFYSVGVKKSGKGRRKRRSQKRCNRGSDPPSKEKRTVRLPVSAWTLSRISS
jgi:hypothetical protein